MTSTAQAPTASTTPPPPAPAPQDDENPGQSTGQLDPTNLIVNYLPPSVGQDDLRRMFEPYGKIERCKILVDRKGTHVTGAHKGAHVSVRGRGGPLAPGPGTRKGKPALPRRRVGTDRTDSGRVCGRVCTDGHSLGFGFVKFSRSEEAQAAIQHLNGTGEGRTPADGGWGMAGG